MYRIGLLHSHPLIAWAVDRALAAVPELTVSVLDGDSGTASAEYDVLITDQVPGHPGSGRVVPRASCVLLMSPLAREHAAETVGVDGYLSEYSSPSELVRAVHRAAVAQRPPDDPAAQQGTTARLAELSLREQQVLGCIADGLTHAQAARRLGISQHTVDTYVKRIRSKLGLGNKAELVRAAMSLSWARALTPSGSW